ncbi:MAG: DNA repair protein RecO [Panacagrimonas sp.]
MRRVSLQPAWILKSSPYGDTSLLVEAISQDFGRVGLVARGVRGPKSKTRVLLQSFRPLLLSWNEAGDLGTLTGVEANGLPVGLSGEQVFSGWYLNELLLRLLHRHDPHAAVFAAYTDAIDMLAETDARALRFFEKRLLSELGFGLDLPDDLDPERCYRLDPEREPMPCANDDINAIPGSSLIALRDDSLHSARELHDARTVLRAALAPHLGDRPLAAAQVLRALKLRSRKD